MNTNKISLSTAVGILILSMLACNLGNGAAPQATQSPESATNESPAGVSSNACENPYLPVTVGATWNYKITGPVPDTFTRSIISVETGKFTDQDIFGTGATRQGNWNCENGNLIALNPSEGSSATVSTENTSVDFQTTASSGLTLPSTINAGDEWSQSTTLEGNEDINGTIIPAKNEFTTTCKAAGAESITVEAGTFDSMKVECLTVMNLTLTMSGAPIQNTLNLNATNWYVEKIGLVKTMSHTDGFDSAIELLSYNIP